MPLISGYSKTSISKNISKLRREGYPEKQAVAIAFSEARKAAKKAGKKGLVRKLSKKNPKTESKITTIEDFPGTWIVVPEGSPNIHIGAIFKEGAKKFRPHLTARVRGLSDLGTYPTKALALFAIQRIYNSDYFQSKKNPRKKSPKSKKRSTTKGGRSMATRKRKRLSAAHKRKISLGVKRALRKKAGKRKTSAKRKSSTKKRKVTRRKTTPKAPKGKRKGTHFKRGGRWYVVGANRSVRKSSAAAAHRAKTRKRRASAKKRVVRRRR